MQSIRDSILRHLRVSLSTRQLILPKNVIHRQHCTSTQSTHDQVTARVIGLVKKFDKIDATKVTGLADFQKDLSLDSLDRVELVMAFEQEFSIEIPDEQADKLKCCADVAQYILSSPKQNS
ncbi:hypothetical protein L1887_17235 [Cichorium endivia]|nr:hypothetical protein L1887_17235 [Cichorium endivia]